MSVFILDDNKLKIVNDMYKDLQFCCKIDKPEHNIKNFLITLCQCNCCERHESCKPDVGFINYIEENYHNNKDNIINQINNDKCCGGKPSYKVQLMESFHTIGMLMKNNKDIENELGHLFNSFGLLMMIFSSYEEIKIFCKIFEFKMMYFYDPDFMKEDIDNRIEVLENISSWCIDIYDTFKLMFIMDSSQNETFEKGKYNNISNSNYCLCGCRKLSRTILHILFNEETKVLKKLK